MTQDKDLSLQSNLLFDLAISICQLTMSHQLQWRSKWKTSEHIHVSLVLDSTTILQVIYFSILNPSSHMCICQWEWQRRRARLTRNEINFALCELQFECTISNLLSVMTLDQPVRKSKYVIPVCLPKPQSPAVKEKLVGRRATIVGWGTRHSQEELEVNS